MNSTNLKDLLKISFKYSFILVLLTGFLEKIYFILFNIQKTQNIGIAQILFNPYTYMIVFIIILVSAHNKYNINKVNTFYGLLLITLLFILFSYTLQYVCDLLFYHLNELIHKPIKEKANTGILSILEDMSYTFRKNNFSPISHLLINPISNLISFNFTWIISTIALSKIILSTIVIFYESLFLLFKRLNKSGYKAIIPILNNLTLIKIANKPLWWIIPILIPFLRFIPKYYINLEIAKTFNKNKIFALGMTCIPFYFYGLIAFNKS